MADKNLDPLAGKWKITEFYKKGGGEEWDVIEFCMPNPFTWEFRQTKSYAGPGGKTVFEGILKEAFEGGPVAETGFFWYPDDRLLIIDRSDYEDDGFLVICFEDRYRVGFVSETECRLNDLHDVENEPVD